MAAQTWPHVHTTSHTMEHHNTAHNRPCTDHTTVSMGFKGSGLDPPLSSLRTCLTAFIAFSVPRVFESPLLSSIWLFVSPALPPCWGKRQVLLVLSFSAGPRRFWDLCLVVALIPCSMLVRPALWAPLGHTPVALAFLGMEGLGVRRGRWSLVNAAATSLRVLCWTLGVKNPSG